VVLVTQDSIYQIQCLFHAIPSDKQYHEKTQIRYKSFLALWSKSK
jgi:hypothetical protein